MLQTIKKRNSSGTEQLLTVGVCSLYALQLISEYPVLWAFAGVGSLYIALQQQKRFKLNKKWLWGIIGLLMIPALINAWAAPGSAEVLLTRVQDFFGTSFGGGTYAAPIDLIFNSARGIYIFLLLIAAWQGWQSYQQSDETGAFVRNMLYSLLVIFAVDVFSTFVVPGSTGTGGTT